MSKKNKSQKQDTPVIPDKLPYTKGEKAAEILSVIYCVISAAAQFILFGLGIFGPSAIFTGIVTLIECAAFTFGSAFPQHTNIFDGKIKVTEEMFRNVRKHSIIAKFILATVIFLIVLL